MGPYQASPDAPVARNALGEVEFPRNIGGSDLRKRLIWMDAAVQGLAWTERRRLARLRNQPGGRFCTQSMATSRGMSTTRSMSNIRSAHQSSGVAARESGRQKRWLRHS